jgi:ethanolamine utilization protein EutQ (cupin superfamily)
MPFFLSLCKMFLCVSLLLFFTLITFLLILVYPKQYYEYVAPFVSPTRSSQHVRIVDGIQSNQLESLLQQAYFSDFPLIIKGGVKHWKATNTWTPQKMREEVGDDAVVTLQSGVQEQEAKPFTITTMGAFVDWLENQEKEEDGRTGGKDGIEKKVYYMAEEFDFIEHHGGLAEEIGLYEFDNFWHRHDLSNSLSSWFEFLFNGFGSSSPRRSNSMENMDNSKGFETAFWMGSAGARTGWHIDHDYPLNILCHLQGKKTLWIAHPNNSANMYPSNKYDPGAVLSNVNFFNPNYNKYPKYSNVSYEKVVLHPGDVMFIPMGYWHAAESNTYTTSISLRSMTNWYWFLNYPDRLLEWLFYHGWWVPSHGSTEKEKNIRREEL